MYENLLTPREVADRLGASVLTIRKWIREGRIPAIRLGERFIRLDWDEVVATIRTSGRTAP